MLCGRGGAGTGRRVCARGGRLRAETSGSAHVRSDEGASAPRGEGEPAVAHDLDDGVCACVGAALRPHANRATVLRSHSPVCRRRVYSCSCRCILSVCGDVCLGVCMISCIAYAFDLPPPRPRPRPRATTERPRARLGGAAAAHPHPPTTCHCTPQKKVPG